MAVSPLKSKALQYRSLSFPSTSNQATTGIEESLSEVKAFQTKSSLSLFSDRVSAIKKLYSNLDGNLSLPLIRQSISQENEEKWVEQVLDGHIKLLDASSTARDLFSHIKHDVQDLLSALRRKDIHGVQVYLTSRKNSRKMIQKSLKDLRSSRSKQAQFADDDTVCLFKEAESATLVMIESMFDYATGTKTQARQSGWSLVSKLMQSNKVSHQDLNEFMKVDALLKTSHEDDAQVKEIVNHLKEMESRIQLLEEELECFFRQLIKTRVSLLNSLNH